MTAEQTVTGSFDVQSTSAAIIDIAEKITTAMEAKHFSMEEAFAVRLALEEAFLNAIKHGNKMDKEKKVKVDYSIGQGKTDITIADQGDGFDPNDIPDPRQGENLLKTGGRGLLLMQTYMDTVEFNDTGNIVQMVKFRQKQSSRQVQGQSN